MIRDLRFAAAVRALGEEATSEAIAEIGYYSDLIYGMIGVITTAVFFCLMAGIVQIIRQLIWGEPIFFGDDFKNGMKGNAIRFLLLSLIIGANSYVLRLMSDSTLSYILFPIYSVILIPIALWMGTQWSYYKLGWIASIKNGFLFYIKTFPATLLMTACTVIPFYLAINFVGNFPIKYVVLVVLSVLYVPFLMTAWVAYACGIFDRYVNKEHYPSIYRKGLGPEQEESKP